MITDIKNGVGELSSDSGLDLFEFTLLCDPWEKHEFIPSHPSNFGKIVEQTRLLGLGLATSLEEGHL